MALTHRARTPAGWVTEPAPPAPAKDHRLPPNPPRVLDTHPVELTTDHLLPAAATDPQWQARTRGRHRAWRFWVTDKEAIAWFNARHDVRELLPTEANGYARATWRGERTPSVAYVAPNGWIDYGHSSRPDGRRDGGDAFDALCRRVARGHAKSRQWDATGAAWREDPCRHAVLAWAVAYTGSVRRRAKGQSRAQVKSTYSALHSMWVSLAL